MLSDAMSFSSKTEKDVPHLENLIDELSWGLELHETFTLKNKITFKLINVGHIPGVLLHPVQIFR
jgi:metallo-beta-lactamase family protein